MITRTRRQPDRDGRGGLGDQDVPFVSIVDDVVLDRERANAFAKLQSEATHPRLFGQQVESVDNGVDQSVGCSGAGVLGDVGPDLVKVLLGKSRQPIRRLRLRDASRTPTRLDSLGELPA